MTHDNRLFDFELLSIESMRSSMTLFITSMLRLNVASDKGSPSAVILLIICLRNSLGLSEHIVRNFYLLFLLPPND